MAGEVIELKADNFDEAIKKDRLVVVEFYTNTCSNCASMKPVYEELARELKDEAHLMAVNASLNPQLATRYGVMGVPTFVYFCSERPIGSYVGAVNATIMRNTIRDFVRHKNECASNSTPIAFEIDGYM